VRVVPGQLAASPGEALGLLVRAHGPRGGRGKQVHLRVVRKAAYRVTQKLGVVAEPVRGHQLPRPGRHLLHMRTRGAHQPPASRTARTRVGSPPLLHVLPVLSGRNEATLVQLEGALGGQHTAGLGRTAELPVLAGHRQAREQAVLVRPAVHADLYARLASLALLVPDPGGRVLHRQTVLLIELEPARAVRVVPAAGGPEHDRHYAQRGEREGLLAPAGGHRLPDALGNVGASSK
jgi:hypothetical protein